MRIESVQQHSSEAARQADWPAGWRSVLSHTHTFSGRDDHGGPVPPPESYQQLVAWARRCGIDAVGMGSPYTPNSARTYGKYDQEETDTYYRGGFDQLSVLDNGEVERMLSEVGRLAGGRTLYYLDNETPKGRYGHLWWLGYHYDYPAWHDYDQPFDRWMVNESCAGDYAEEPVPYERRPYMQIVAAQRSRGALGFWAHPTSWWWGDGRRFITNIATEMPAHAIADGFVDGMVIMGYHPYRPQYLALWFEMLDRGWRVPGVAEMDCGLSDPKLWNCESALLTYAYCNGTGLSVPSLRDTFRQGRVFASSGPFVNLEIDGRTMGEVAPTQAERVHKVTLTALPRPGDDLIGRVELVGRGGRVLWRRDHWSGGSLELRISGLGQRGYLVARVFGADSRGVAWRDVKQIAVSNPVYLHPRGERFNEPALTDVELTFRDDSPFLGGEMRFESAGGEILSAAMVHAGMARESLPASGRITLLSRDGHTCRTDYLINANRKLQDVQRYLYRGRFLNDFPSLEPGEVPPQAWRFDDYVEAMASLKLAY